MAPLIVNRRRDADIVARYQKGATLRALAALYCMSDTRVSQVLKKQGIKTRRQLRREALCIGKLGVYDAIS